MKKLITAWFDGSITKNPGGRASYGIIIKEDGKEIFQETQVVGEGDKMSCNVAEYAGLFAILDFILCNNLKNENITIIGDSQIVINTMNDWRKPFSKGFCLEISSACKSLNRKIQNINYKWVRREFNAECDAISK